MIPFSIAITPRVLHFKQPAGTSRGIYHTRRLWLLTLTSDEKPEVRGVGECAPLPGLSCDDLPEYENVLRSACDEFSVKGQIDYDRLRPYPSILFGLETALKQWQADGSTALSSTAFARGEKGIPINGLVWMGTFEEMCHRIEEKIEQGFRCIKLKVGAIDFEREVDLIRSIRQHFTKEQIELRLDANGGFSADEALPRLDRLARFDIHSIEQPICQGQWAAMAEICRSSPIPIALDEELIGINQQGQKEELLDRLQPAYIILKPSLHGGMYGATEWIGLARQRNIDSWITSALESNVGLNSIAHFAATVYGDDMKMPQGLGTGQLFTDNIPMPLTIKGEQLWYSPSF